MRDSLNDELCPGRYLLIVLGVWPIPEVGAKLFAFFRLFIFVACSLTLSQLHHACYHWADVKILTAMRLREAIWPNKYLLTMFGLWPMHPNTSLTRRVFSYLRFIVALSAVISVLIPEVVTIVDYWGDIGILGDLGSVMVVHTLLAFKMLYYLSRRQSFRRMYEYLKDFWSISDDPRERRHYERPANLAKLMTIAYYMMGMTNMLIFEVAALVNWMASRRETNETLRHRPLLAEFTYGFDTQRTPAYELVLVSQNFCGFCGIGAVVGLDSNMVVFIVHVSAQFKLIAARFCGIGRAIGERSFATEDELRRKIGQLVAQHQHTISVAKDLSALLSPVIFGQIVTSGIELCLGGYAVIEGEGSFIEIAKFLVIFVTLLIQLVVFCAPAEILIQQSVLIAEAIYCEVPWFTLSPSLRRDLNFVMMRAQKACHVSALYQVMSIRRITEVVNAAGSYMALLRSMKT